MIDVRLLRKNISRNALLFGTGFGILSWILDAGIDSFLYRKGDFASQLLPSSAIELGLRLFIMTFLAGAGVYLALFMNRLRKAEAVLYESEQRYRSLIDTARDVIFTTSMDGTLTSVNPASETITGWDRAELLGRPFHEFIHPDDLPSALDRFQQLREGHAPKIFELRVRSKSGDYLTGEFTTTTHVLDGKVVGILGIGRDITDRKRIEKALQDSEEKYRDLFENANDLIQSIAPDGSIHYVNRAWRETLGYSEEELARLDFMDIIHPDYREHCMDLFRRVIAGENIDRVEAMFVTKSNRSIVVAGSINCIMKNGRVVATRGIFTDITDRRLAEEFIKNILESVDESFIVIGRDYLITSANKAYCDKVKLPIQEVVGKHCYKISHRLNKPCHEAGEDCAVLRTFQTGEPHIAVHTHYDKDKNPIFIEAKSFPLKDSLGRIVSAIEILNDVTDKMKLEEQLRHAQKMEAVGTLAGGVAHDFNNILTAIIGYGSLLKMKMGEHDPLRSNVDQILVSAERAAGLTQSLLAFSRKQPMSRQPVDLNFLVKRVEKLLVRLIGEDIEVRILPGDTNATILGDAGQIEQVLMNLATNARDAMPRGGLLLIETGLVELDSGFIRAHGYGRVGRYVHFSVTDSGTGMDENTRKRIFEPFFTTKEVGKGTGLGLAIVYGIIKQHNGYITVDSEPGEGAKFNVYLPLASAPAAHEHKLPEASLPHGGTATILVAEDDAIVRKLTTSVLEGFGYNVIEAADGNEAVEQFVKHQDTVQLLLLDLIMPKKSGREAYEAINRLKPGIKALFTSGYTAELIQEKSAGDNAFSFISKPSSPRDLLKKVRDILDSETNKNTAVSK